MNMTRGGPNAMNSATHVGPSEGCVALIVVLVHSATDVV